jgi:signal transduction histidine kinase
MQITRQISEFSVPQSQLPELIDLNGLLRSTVNFVKFDRRFRQVDVFVVLDANLPAVLATADHLVQVAMNLLINAADAFENRGESPPAIRVVSSRQGDYVIFKVFDNAAGMEPEILERVFEERFSTKGPGRGSGLGLYLCRSLIEKAGGVIEIFSQPGKGTEVQVRLPIALPGADLA